MSQAETPMEKDWVIELARIMAVLRAPGGCPWDAEQTHASLKPYLAEEAAEVLDAIDEGDDQALADELGDLLLQVVFHCQIAQEEGRFTLQDVARGICEKLRRRHPHVFAEAKADTPQAVLAQWERIKKAERGNESRRKSAVEGVPRSLPALHRAHKMQKKAASVGFDWPAIEGVMAKIEEELAEVKGALASGDDDAVAAEIGDLLFAVVNLSRFRNRVAEELLQGTIKKFERRFRRIEEVLAERGLRPEDCSLEELDALWNRAKP